MLLVLCRKMTSNTILSPSTDITMSALPPLSSIPTHMIIDYMSKLFSIGDTNGDGVLSPTEFAEVRCFFTEGVDAVRVLCGRAGRSINRGTLSWEAPAVGGGGTVVVARSATPTTVQKTQSCHLTPSLYSRSFSRAPGSTSMPRPS